MRKLEDNLKVVLCDIVAKGSSWQEAYGELLGVFQANADDLATRGAELENKLKQEGKSDRYIDLRLGAFRIAYDREMLCLHTTRKLQAEGYQG
jgi:hypothetical protein